MLATGTLKAPTAQLSRPLDIREKLRAYYSGRTRDDRDRSWEFCYRYFHHAKPEAIKTNRHHAALQLGFYLASWGMYRNSFLLQYAYTVHLGAVDCLLESKFSRLWTEEFGASDNDADLVPLILEACESVRATYRSFAEAQHKTVTDTLLTKVVLGTMGCLPALDEYFKSGIGGAKLNAAFIHKVRRFCRDNFQVLQDEQAALEDRYQMHCPLMKLVDAYFHRAGQEIKAAKPKHANNRKASLLAGRAPTGSWP